MKSDNNQNSSDIKEDFKVDLLDKSHITENDIEQFQLKDLLKNKEDYFRTDIQKTWIIFLIIIVMFIIGYFGFKTFYNEPTCFDGKVGKDEKGVDCGGICSLQCYGDYNNLKVKNSQILNITNRDDIVILFENNNIKFAPQNISFDLHITYTNNSVEIISKNIQANSGTITPFIYINNNNKKIKSFEVKIKDTENKFYPISIRREVPVKSFSVNKVSSGYKIDYIYNNIYNYYFSANKGMLVLYDKADKIVFANYIEIGNMDIGYTKKSSEYSYSDPREAVRAEIYLLEYNFDF